MHGIVAKLVRKTRREERRAEPHLERDEEAAHLLMKYDAPSLRQYFYSSGLVLSSDINRSNSGWK